MEVPGPVGRRATISNLSVTCSLTIDGAFGLRIDSGVVGGVQGGLISNSGTIKLLAGEGLRNGASTLEFFNGDLVLGGGGLVLLGQSPPAIPALPNNIIRGDVGKKLINDNQILGAGTIETAFENSSQITADINGRRLRIVQANDSTNLGELSASNGGVWEIDNSTITNERGEQKGNIVAEENSQVRIGVGLSAVAFAGDGGAVS